ncbi:MAG: hypothetical protein JXK94_12200 [Deltaproteobacteria bacterium]|nr:hypothetical protein [Deltaproteobacteria bacterium]
MALKIVFQEALIIAGINLDLVQRCLDQSLDPSTSLLESGAYKTYCADLFKPGETDVILFGDLDHFITTAGKVVHAQMEQDPRLAGVEKQLADMQGLTTLALACYDDGGPLLNSKLVLGIDRNVLSPTLATAFGVEPMTNPTLDKVPAKALIYSWQNNFNAAFYWQEFQKSPELTPENIEKIKNEFALNTGVELDNFLAAFGSQVGFLINDINTGGMFPIPEAALVFEVKNPVLVEQAIQTVVGQMGMPLQQEAHNGIGISYVALPMGADLSPAYVCADGFCTLTVNKNLLTSMLDASQNGSIKTQPGFKAVNRGITGKNNQVSYANVEGLIGKTKDISAWALAWMAATQPDRGEKGRRMVELVLNPLLDGFSMYNSIGSRVYIENDRMVSDTYVSVNRP